MIRYGNCLYISFPYIGSSKELCKVTKLRMTTKLLYVLTVEELSLLILKVTISELIEERHLGLSFKQIGKKLGIDPHKEDVLQVGSYNATSWFCVNNY